MIRIICEWSSEDLERALNELISANPGSRVVGMSSHHVPAGEDWNQTCSPHCEYVAAVEVDRQVLENKHG